MVHQLSHVTAPRQDGQNGQSITPTDPSDLPSWELNQCQLPSQCEVMSWAQAGPISRLGPQAKRWPCTLPLPLTFMWLFQAMTLKLSYSFTVKRGTKDLQVTCFILSQRQGKCTLSSIPMIISSSRNKQTPDSVTIWGCKDTVVWAVFGRPEGGY